MPNSSRAVYTELNESFFTIGYGRCKLTYFRRGDLAHLYSTDKHFLK